MPFRSALYKVVCVVILGLMMQGCEEEQVDPNIVVYPNPCIDRAVIWLTEVPVGTVVTELIDNMNQVQVSVELPTASTVTHRSVLIDTSPLSSGRYNVRCTLADGDVRWIQLIRQ